MRFNIISNLNNGAGLQQDYNLLRADLEALGHTVCGIQFNAPAKFEAADVNVFLEVIDPQFFRLAPRNWVVPNPEWWFPGWDCHLNQFEWVLAKTRDCERLFCGKAQTKFLGWRSRDLMDESVTRESRFLHVAGKSQTKNTRSALEAWRRGMVPAELTIVSRHYRDFVARVRCLDWVADADMRHLMNSHRFHLMPSAYEGWGHALHEALSVGGVVITTNAPPMNEIPAPLLIAADKSVLHHAVQLNSVTPENVAAACRKALEMDETMRQAEASKARAAFAAETEAFRARLKELAA